MKSCWRKEDFIVNCTTASSPSHKEAAVIKRETDRQETRGQEKLRILVSACCWEKTANNSGGSNRDENGADVENEAGTGEKRQSLSPSARKWQEAFPLPERRQKSEERES